MHKFLKHYRPSITVPTGIMGVLFIIAVAQQGCKTANSRDPISAAEPSSQDTRTSPAMKPDHSSTPTIKDASHTVIAYYFHRTVRCPGCLQIEFMADQAIRETFDQELKEGNLVWLVLNMEEPDNQEFVDEYDVDASTLLLTDSVSNGKGRWKKLEKVWELMREPEAFGRYVEKEVADYLTAK